MRVILFSLFCLVIESRAEFEPCTPDLIVKSVVDGKLVCNLTSRSDIDRCKVPFEHLELKSNGRSGRCQSSGILVFDTPKRLTADSVANKLISTTSDRLQHVQDLATLIGSLQVLPSKYPNRFVLSQAVERVQPTTTFTVRGGTDKLGLCRKMGRFRWNRHQQYTWHPGQCCGWGGRFCSRCRSCDRVPNGIKPDSTTKTMVVLKNGKYMCQSQNKQYYWNSTDCLPGAFNCRTCHKKPSKNRNFWRIFGAVVGGILLCVVTYGLASFLLAASAPAALPAAATALTTAKISTAAATAGGTTLPLSSMGATLGPGAWAVGAVSSTGTAAVTTASGAATGLTVSNVPAAFVVATAAGRRLLSGNNTNNNNDLAGAAPGRRLLSSEDNTSINNDLSFLDRTIFALAEEAQLLAELDEDTGDALLQCSNDDIPIYQDFVQKITEDVEGENEYVEALAAADFSAQGLSDGCPEAVSRHWELEGNSISGAQIVVPTTNVLVTVSAILLLVRGWR